MASTTSTAPSRASNFHLRVIDESNYEAIAKLETTPAQAGNLSKNPCSMLAGVYSEDAWMRALYADDTPVGLLLMAIWPPNDGYYIWRLMIDARYQGLGFGAKAVQSAIDHVKTNYPEAKHLKVGSTPEEGSDRVLPKDSPYHFYTKLGFKQIAPPDEDNEVMLSIDL